MLVYNWKQSEYSYCFYNTPDPLIIMSGVKMNCHIHSSLLCMDVYFIHYVPNCIFSGDPAFMSFSRHWNCESNLLVEYLHSSSNLFCFGVDGLCYTSYFLIIVSWSLDLDLALQGNIYVFRILCLPSYHVVGS